MTTPQENPTGYDNNSPLTYVDQLKGDFLLVHGSADDNVHFQNTMRLTEALIQAKKILIGGFILMTTTEFMEGTPDGTSTKK